jgi:hypothetical protein
MDTTSTIQERLAIAEVLEPWAGAVEASKAGSSGCSTAEGAGAGGAGAGVVPGGSQP